MDRQWTAKQRERFFNLLLSFSASQRQERVEMVGG
jgi:hypothetical protein